MRDHVAVGHDILVAAGFVEEAIWVLHHHEHHDGTGYPEGFTGDEIPLESRIISVADAFEAMTGARPYRETLSPRRGARRAERAPRDAVRPSCVDALAALRTCRCRRVGAGGRNAPSTVRGLCRAEDRVEEV